jgi:hypothetical protein
MILRCDCKHEFQDKEYGPGRRLHNLMGHKEGQSRKYRCAVCGKEREAGKEADENIRPIVKSCP